MSKYKVEENELSKAIAYLEVTKTQLQRCVDQIADANYGINDQTGANIDSGKYRSSKVSVNLKKQMDNICNIQDYMRGLINDTNESVNSIRNEIAKINVSKVLGNGAGKVAGTTSVSDGNIGVEANSQTSNAANGNFVPRTEAPILGSEPYYTRFVEGNCAKYAVSRASEIRGETVELNGNPSQWWKECNKYAGCSENVNEPRVGAIIVWGGNNDNPYGHTAVVEEIVKNEDGSVREVIFSESSSGGLWYNDWGVWGRQTNTTDQLLKNPQGYRVDGYGNKIKLQDLDFVGYIYI